MAFDTKITNSVTTSITGAAFADGAALSGTWTANYNSTGGLVSVTNASFTVAGPGGTNTFTNMGTLPYAQDPTSSGFTSYEIHNLNGSGTGSYNSLYIDWKTETPSSFYEGSPSLYTSIKNGAVSTSNSIRLVNDGSSGTGSVPVITGLPATESGTDNMNVVPFSGVTVTDADSATTTSATIILSANGTATDANGALSGAGLTKIATGTYSLAATSPANLTSELQALRFTPTSGQVSAGNAVATQIDLAVNDSDGSAERATNLNVFAACFLAGTRLAVPGGSRAVEEIGIGDQVLLASGAAAAVKWVGWHSHHRRFAANNPELLPVRIAAGALAHGVPARDLFVSPNHAMFLPEAGGVFIHAGELVNGRSIARLAADEAPEVIRYFHVELARHGVILAEAAPTESYAAYDNRDKFHNAAEFYARYPEETQARQEFCAPLIAHGPVLEAARLRLAMQAGLAGPSDAAAPDALPGALLGNIDVLAADLAEGWALDGDDRDTPLRLEVHDHGRLIATTVADRYRPDLAEAGICQGRAGFRVNLPPATAPRHITIHRDTDGAVLATEVKPEYQAA